MKWRNDRFYGSSLCENVSLLKLVHSFYMVIFRNNWVYMTSLGIRDIA